MRVDRAAACQQVFQFDAVQQTDADGQCNESVQIYAFQVDLLSAPLWSVQSRETVFPSA